MMERFEQMKDRMRGVSERLGPMYAYVYDLRKKGAATAEDLYRLDHDLHDIVGGLASVLNSIRFAERDFEKYRRYRVVVDDWDEMADHHTDDDGNALTAESAKKLASRLRNARVETQIATPWEVVKDEALDR